MKSREIVIGGVYSDSKGGVRQVIDKGSQYIEFPGQMNCKCLRYKQLAKIRGHNIVGDEYNCTVAKFASWAKEKVHRRNL